MIQKHLNLQIKRSNRYIKEFGLHPVLGYLLMGIAFVLGSSYLFRRTEWAPYVYIAIGTAGILWINQHKSTHFFQSIYSKKDYFRVKYLEALFLGVPFSLFLLYQGDYYHALACIPIVLLSSLISIPFTDLKPFPTPFSHHPFEFALGFRSTYWLYLSLFFILFMAVGVDNFNLGIATLLAVFIISLTFYSNLEERTYIWNHKGTSITFLRKKVISGLGHVSLFTVPILIVLLSIWSSHYLYILGVQCLGYIYLLTMVLAKYAAFPRMMSLPQGLIIVFCFWLPPLLLIAIPYLFIQSDRSLKSILQ